MISQLVTSTNFATLVLSSLLPKPYSVPANTYQTKDLVDPLMMGVKRIQTCPNHCILYQRCLKTCCNVQPVDLVYTEGMIITVRKT